MLKQILNSRLEEAYSHNRISKSLYTEISHRLAQGELVKEERTESHCCCFFVPIHRPSGSIYLGHHVKADAWIPPGGHIDTGETPEQTIVREFKEELREDLDPSLINYISASKKVIKNDRSPCKTHYDFWFWLDLPEKITYDFDRKEYYDANWFSFEEAFGLDDKNPEFKVVIAQIIDEL